MNNRLIPMMIISAAFLSASLSPAAGEVTLERRLDLLTIGNSALARSFRLGDGTVRTTAIENRPAERTLSVHSDEFVIELFRGEPRGGVGGGPAAESPDRLTVSDFYLEDWESRETKTGGLELVFQLIREEQRLRVEVIYQLEPGSSLLRKRLRIEYDGGGLNSYRPLLHRLAIESFGPAPTDTIIHGGLGQPAFIGDLFIGMEHPAGFNRSENGRFDSYIYPGLPLEPGVNEYPSVVLGVAAEGDVEFAFRDYVAALRRRPPTPFILYNSWYDLQAQGDWPLNHETATASLKEFDRKFRKHDLQLDSFVLDDGYDVTTSVYETDRGRFPRGFKPMVDYLQGMDSGLGLWLSPFAGYGRDWRERAAWLTENGYEMSGGRPCLAGKKYFEALTSRFEDYIRKYDVNYLKLDGITSRCNEPDHGHPTGIYSLWSETEALRRMIDRFRKIKPDIFINITTGSWMSPWWLADADCVWIGGADYGYAGDVPSISKRDLAITYRDGILHYDFRERQFRFPTANIMTVGIIKGNYNMLGGLDEPLRKWTDNAVILVGRGVKMLELYLTPQVLNEAEWANLAAALKWAKTCSDELSGVRMIMGNPLRGEIYGFAGFHRGSGVAVLRNPSRYPAQTELVFDHTMGIRGRNGSWRGLIAYPYRAGLDQTISYNDRLTVALDPYETRVMEFRPDTDEAVELAGVRYRRIDGWEGTAKFRLYGHPGEEIEVIVPAGDAVLAFKLDGESIEPIRREAGYVIPCVIPGELVSGETVTGPHWTVPRLKKTESTSGGSTARISLKVDITVPAGVKSPRIILLAEGEADLSGLALTATVNGRETAISRLAEPNNGVWFFCDLFPGKNRIELDLGPGEMSGFSGYLSLLIDYESPLAEGPLLEVGGITTGVGKDRPRLPDFSPIESKLTTILDRLPVEITGKP